VLGSFQKGSIVSMDNGAPGVQSIGVPLNTADAARVALGFDRGNLALYNGGAVRVIGTTTGIDVSTVSANGTEVTFGVVRPNNVAVHPRIHA